MSNENSSIEQPKLVDPSLENGGDVIFDQDTPLKFQDEEQRIVDEAPFHFRIITYGDKSGKFDKVRFEITMEGNLFFFNYAEFDEDEYERFKQETDISVNLQDFPKKIIEYMKLNLDKDENYTVVLSQSNDDKYILGFKQRLAIKEVELVAIELYPESDEFVNRQIQYRFDAARQQLKIARNEKEDLCKLMNVNETSPLVKAAARTGKGTPSPRPPK